MRTAERLAPILFGSINTFAAWKNDQLERFDSELIDDEAKEAISEITHTPGKYGMTIRVKLHDKQAAWEKVCRMLGFFQERSTIQEMLDAVRAVDPDLAEAMHRRFFEQKNQFEQVWNQHQERLVNEQHDEAALGPTEEAADDASDHDAGDVGDTV